VGVEGGLRGSCSDLVGSSVLSVRGPNDVFSPKSCRWTYVARSASDERATSPVPPSPAALHCRCREFRVLGLKKTVGAEVFDLVLVERNEHLPEVGEAIRAPGDLRQSAHQLALPVDWEAKIGRASCRERAESSV